MHGVGKIGKISKPGAGGWLANKKAAPDYGTAFLFDVGFYFTDSITDLNASGLFIARSARTLRFKSIPFS